ncbi:hypothetical protein [Streptomyces mangrovisoli]|uniref:DUF3828 domain-containing protein n=1 Tax=Streptomyces mangrovisoli TaxID=1428628 RepID=A0A1J4NMF9_9ACTN|nr:hypothetical protein [Streptomyces mangrovisoli]OIJ63511.1 hypothetical protein WN71_033750 [Streptomyces mangrovisoli]
MNSKARTILTAGVVAVALGIGVTTQASAGAPRTVSGKASDDITRIADFYGTYIDAELDKDGDNLPEALRAHYLTPAFQKQLAAWENREHADGVLRAQNVPSAWKVTDNGTVGNHREALVTLTWGGGTTTKLVVDMTRDTHRISRIGEKPAAGK